MMQRTILVVENESLLRKLLKNHFENEGHRVWESSDGKEGLELFQAHAIDLVVIDVKLPGLNGWDLCRHIRKISDVPIILLIAREDEQDALLGFELGADDYVTKPYSPPLLMARAKRLLNSRPRQMVSPVQEQTAQGSEDVISCCGIYVHLPSRMVMVDGERVYLTYTEFEILLHLMQNQGIVVTREQLIVKIWGYEYVGHDRTINTHMGNIRQKLGDKGKLITTVVRIGYKFECPTSS
ncbi:putative transcriptional regulatory protein YclJ [Paenibacillus alvei DSM 29]|nr:putative transcriptional regulatory protein YclJ [Paenibacillus alvei DSM 29]